MLLAAVIIIACAFVFGMLLRRAVQVDNEQHERDVAAIRRLIEREEQE